MVRCYHPGAAASNHPEAVADRPDHPEGAEFPAVRCSRLEAVASNHPEGACCHPSMAHLAGALAGAAGPAGAAVWAGPDRQKRGFAVR